MFSVAAVVNGLKYLLSASFNISNVTFTNAQTLDTEAEGVQVGSFIVIETGTGSVQVVSNQLEITPGNLELFTVSAIASQAITRTLGTTLFNKVIIPDAAPFGFHNSQTPSSSTEVFSLSCGQSSDGDILVNHNDAASVTTVTIKSTILNSDNHNYDFAIMLGGYDSGGIPYTIGDTKANFKYGATAFAKNLSTSGDWELLWKSEEDNTATLYAGFIGEGEGQTASRTHTLDNIRIPDVDLSDLLEPILFDKFTDTDSTAITSHTPDIAPVGSSWAYSEGTASQIQGNAWSADSDNGSVIDCGESDVLVTADYNSAFLANNRSSIIIRYIDGANGWYCRIRTNEDDISINELTTGTWTTRATTSTTMTGANDYKIKATSVGNDITLYSTDESAGGHKSVTYNSTSHNTATKVGLHTHTGSTLTRIDNFAVYDIKGDYTKLDNYPGEGN